MIAHDQILPSLYQLRRNGLVDDIQVCGQRSSTLRALVDSPVLQRAFPTSLHAVSAVRRHESGSAAETVRAGGRALPEQSIVIVALPDHLHKEAILYALRCNQHVIALKPLVLNCADSDEIEREARSRGLFVASSTTSASTTAA